MKSIIIRPLMATVIEDGVEDVHSQVELMPTASWVIWAKIHSGRESNDQVLLDMKLYARTDSGPCRDGRPL